MKTTGYVIKIDESKRFQIPMALREKMNISHREALEFFTDGDYIIIEKYKERCCICGNCENIKVFKEKFICEECIEGIVNF